MLLLGNTPNLWFTLNQMTCIDGAVRLGCKFAAVHSVHIFVSWRPFVVESWNIEGLTSTNVC